MSQPDFRPPSAQVAYVITSLSMGGAQKVLLALLASELHQGNKPLVVSLLRVTGLEGDFLKLGIEPFYLDLKRPWQVPGRLLRLRQLFRQHRVRLIYSMMHHANLFAVLLAQWLVSPRPALIWGIHDTPVKHLYTRWSHRFLLWLTCRLSAIPNRIVLVSARSRERYLELGYPAAKLCLIPNGVWQVPLDAASWPEERQSVRAELGLPADAILIGSLTRDVPEKDLPCMLAAFASLAGSNPAVHLLLAGEGLDQANPTLAGLVSGQGLAGRVHWLGIRTDAQRLIRSLDIATLSSRSEALPLFMAESMAAGILCVATDVGDIGQLLGGYGKLVPPQEPEALSKAWQQVLDLPEVGRQELRAGAWQRIADSFSLDRMVSQHAGLYRDLLG